MTDNPQDKSDFSFRTFDIYRRFVEVLQHKPAYLEEFKNGAPIKEETCIAMIKRVFQSQQDEDEVKKYIQYFNNHAKMMAGHAEKLPDCWKHAIDYTERYIKAIRNYLRDKGISVRFVMNTVDKLAKDIAKHLHDKPSARQIEAIRYYLKYDLRNPKRNVMFLNMPKNFNSSYKIPRKSSKVKSDKTVEVQGSIQVQKENDESLITSTFAQEVQNCIQAKSKIDSTNNEPMETSPQFEYLETEFIEVDDPLESTEQMHDTNDKKNVKLELKPFNSSIADNFYETKGIEETDSTEPNSSTDAAYFSSPESKDGANDKIPSCKISLKRKSSSPLNNNYHWSLKKQLQFCQRIPNNDQQFQKQGDNDSIRTRNVSFNSTTDSEINIETDDNESEGNTSCDSEMSKQLQNNKFNFKSKVKNMSYTAALNYMELVIAFCQYKNAISKEELNLLLQVKDKMQIKSCDEQSAM